MQPADLITPRNLAIAVAVLLLAPKGPAVDPANDPGANTPAQVRSAVSSEAPRPA